MPPRLARWFLPALSAAGLASIVVQAQSAPVLPDLLQAGADYLVQYSQRLSAIAAQEEYVQYETSSDQVRAPRRLSADVVLVGLEDGAIAGFRDVVAIDNIPVHPRDDRLPNLFTATPSSSFEQARQLTDDSVKTYLSPNLHALDLPTIALEFLRKTNQERSTFSLESVKTMDGVRVAVLKFTERNTPRLIPMTGGGAAIGRFWIDVKTGTVRQTEIGITSKGVSVRVTVKYAAEPPLNLWLPVEMSQHINTTGTGNSLQQSGGRSGLRRAPSHEARATYSTTTQPLTRRQQNTCEGTKRRPTGSVVERCMGWRGYSGYGFAWSPKPRVTAQTPHIPRAPRLDVGVHLRYRPIGESTWRDGKSQNVSCTGVLFQPEAALSRDTTIEMMLEMPAEVPAAKGMLLRRGRIVGACRRHRRDRPAFAAAAFEHDYWPPPSTAIGQKADALTFDTSVW